MGKLEKTMRRINKKSNKEIMQKGAELKKIERIRFPSPRLDYILYGGLPMRRITEISGKENSGKTTTALGFCAKAQEKYEDKKVVYVDAEQVLDKEWAKTIGVNTEELILMRPEAESG
ncbi:MAG: ATPase domain-containing protein, partial [bacterium]